MSVSIHHRRVTALGKAAHGVAHTVDKGVETLKTAEHGVGACHLKGFTTKGALETYFDTWVPVTAGLSLNLGTTGDKLASTANTYLHTDNASVDPFKRVQRRYLPHHGWQD